MHAQSKAGARNITSDYTSMCICEVTCYEGGVGEVMAPFARDASGVGLSKASDGEKSALVGSEVVVERRWRDERRSCESFEV